MARGLGVRLIILVALGVTGFLVLTRPQTLDATALPNHRADLEKGAYLFVAGGCASCHAAPDAADAEATTVLSGGQVLTSAFGTFHVPNISPDKEHGIGNWSPLDFINAMKFGTDPRGRHLYPAFPYPSYQRMTLEDLIDLKAYLDTLPPVTVDVPKHELRFPFNIRRGIGLWNLIYVDGQTFDGAGLDPQLARGAYLVNGPGHCGECHTPRNLIGGPIASRAFAGGPAPDGKGRVPNITPDKTGIGGWSEAEIATALETGFTPEFDSLGGMMAKVVRNTAKLTPEDRRAIAAYLKSLPPIASQAPAKPKEAGEADK